MHVTVIIAKKGASERERESKSEGENKRGNKTPRSQGTEGEMFIGEECVCEREI